MRWMRTVAAVVALGVVAAACGDDDGGGSGDALSDEGREYVEALLAANAESEDEFADLSEDELECMTRAMVDAIGVSQLQGAVTPDEIREDPDADLTDWGVEVNEEQAEAVWDGLTECVDVLDLFLTGVAEDDDLTEETVACIEEEFDEDVLKRLVVASMVEGEDALEEDEELVSAAFGFFAACPEAITSGS